MTQQTLIVKDHFYDHKFHLYNAAIFIVRNPYHTMLAEFKRQKTLSHVGEVDVETIKKGKLNFPNFKCSSLIIVALK